MLKDRSTDTPLFVVIFTLIPKDQAAHAAQQVEAQTDEKNEGGKTSDVKAGGGDDDLD